MSESLERHQERESGFEMSIRELEGELGASRSNSIAQEDEVGRLKGSVEGLQSSLDRSQSELAAAEARIFLNADCVHDPA